MSEAGLLSLLCLVVTGLLATWAVLSRHYDDSLLQRLGLGIIATGCLGRALERLTEDVPDPPPILLWSQVGLALYAIGTALRMYLASRRQPDRRRPRNRRGVAA